MNVGSRMTVGVLPDDAPYLMVPSSSAGYFGLPMGVASGGLKSLFTGFGDARGLRFEFRASIPKRTGGDLSIAYRGLFGVNWAATGSYPAFNIACLTDWIARSSTPALDSASIRLNGSSDMNSAIAIGRYFYPASASYETATMSLNPDSSSLSKEDLRPFVGAICPPTGKESKTVVIDFVVATTGSGVVRVFPCVRVSGDTVNCPVGTGWTVNTATPSSEFLSSKFPVFTMLAGTTLNNAFPGTRIYRFRASRTKPFTGGDPMHTIPEVDEVVWDLHPAAGGKFYDTIGQTYVESAQGKIVAGGNTLY